MIDRCERTDRGSYDHHGTRPRLGKQCHRASTRSCRDNPEGWAPRSRQARFDTSTAGSSPAGSALFFAIWLSASLLSSQAVVSVLCDAPGFARRLESPLDRAYFHRLPSFAPTNLSISQPSPCPPCPLSHILHYFCNGREAGILFIHPGSESNPTARSVHPSNRCYFRSDVSHALFPQAKHASAVGNERWSVVTLSPSPTCR